MFWQTLRDSADKCRGRETPAGLKAPHCDYRSRVRIERKPIPPISPFPLTAEIVPIGNRPDFCYTAGETIDNPV